MFDREIFEHVKRLRLHSDAQTCPLKWMQFRYVSSSKRDYPMIRTKPPDQQLKKCALACTVRADDAADFSGAYRPLHIINGLDSPEVFGNTSHTEQRSGVNHG